jgi:beta-phosphoglucomutase-like phosphatase (HAD superfamily)
VLVSSNTACKAALAAGLRAVAIPDDFTAHQDFGGADIIVDSASDIDAGEILAAMAAK